MYPWPHIQRSSADRCGHRYDPPSLYVNRPWCFPFVRQSCLEDSAVWLHAWLVGSRMEIKLFNCSFIYFDYTSMFLFSSYVSVQLSQKILHRGIRGLLFIKWQNRLAVNFCNWALSFYSDFFVSLFWLIIIHYHYYYWTWTDSRICLDPRSNLMLSSLMIPVKCEFWQQFKWEWNNLAPRV